MKVRQTNITPSDCDNVSLSAKSIELNNEIDFIVNNCKSDDERERETINFGESFNINEIPEHENSKPSLIIDKSKIDVGKQTVKSRHDNVENFDIIEEVPLSESDIVSKEEIIDKSKYSISIII